MLCKLFAHLQACPFLCTLRHPLLMKNMVSYPVGQNVTDHEIVHFLRLPTANPAAAFFIDLQAIFQCVCQVEFNLAQFSMSGG